MGRKDYIIDEHGYYRFASSGKLVHRWIAEKYVVGRKLRPGEVVHHINGNKLDNRSQNLRVFSSQKEHHAMHKKQKRDKAIIDFVSLFVPSIKRKKKRRKRWF